MEDLSNKNKQRDYRISHSSKGYGKRYEETYLKGYYYYQWEEIEKQMLIKNLSLFKEQGSTSLLDFACGTGRILKVCEDIFRKPDGVDISESMLEVAKAHCIKSNIQCIDITKK